MKKIAVLLLSVILNLRTFCYGSRKQPNIIVLLADDVGWGDLASFGHPTQEWGPLDDMTEEGLKFTHFTSAGSMCTPSRAAILTSMFFIYMAQ